ncbi:Ger(x)C family spore germination protein [Gottfriedia acidiceleris]|uniref:Ger(X)C family spore germination protein n=1 Tax=Gottfriedia acidiceleris TaxID=371036 RepID=A0ABY4JNA6_9BACI|nr:Ger(x)C family spore germination protein [Gottfriedia acidiceleris]UPM54197.1 Ger(x)C family spore germination protein [Gottfriedia acidiceleris]
MKRKCIILILITSLLLVSCSNYKELNSVSIVVAMGVDYLPKDNQYNMVLQIINPSAIASITGSIGTPVISLEQKGRTISEAARNITKSVSRSNIYSHVALVVIGENLAKKKSLNYIFDVFERDSKIRVNIPVIIARNDSVYKVMNNLPALDKLPAKSIVGKIKNTSSLLGENQEIQMRQVIAALSSSGREPVVNGAILENETEKSETLDNFSSVKSSYNKIEGLGVIKKGKLVGWLDGPPAKSVQIVDNAIKETNIQIKCSKKEYDSMEITRLKTDTKIKMKNKIPSISINVKAIAIIDEVLCNDNFDQAKTLEKYELLSEKAVKETIEKGIKEAQGYGADIFGFGEKLHLSEPKVFKKYEKNWNDQFQKAKVKVNVDVQINNVGMRKKAYPF